MSVKAMSWVWDCSAAQGLDRFVLLAIADSADHDGTNAWPSVSTLTAKTGLSERTIQRCVASLVTLGELAVRRNAGRHGVNVYQVLMGGDPRQADTPVTVTPPSDSHPRQADTPVTVTPHPRQADTPGGVTQSPHPRQADTRTVLEPSNEPSMTRPSGRARAAGAKGTRISDDFAVDFEMSKWAKEQGFTQAFVNAATAEFIDYWRGVPGAKGLKADWVATWRNSLRGQAMRQGVSKVKAPRPPRTDVVEKGW